MSGPAVGAPDLSGLFQPLRIKGLELPNRFVMPGMQRMWCVDGSPLPRLADYYGARVRGGAGLLITESCAVDHASATQNPMFARMTPATAEAWGACVRAVRAEHGRILLQLWHEGAVRSEGGEGPWSGFPTLSPSGLKAPGKPSGRAATAQELEDIRDAFVRSARLGQDLGFDGVEIHGAHGYLLDQFLWHGTNLRTDGYGGPDIRDRVRFPAEIVAAVREATGPDFVIGFRFSQWKEADFAARVAATPDELKLMLSVLRGAGVDLFHASARRFWTPEWPPSPLGIAGWTRSLTDVPVIAVGSVGLDVDVMESFGGAEARATGAAGLSELQRRFASGEFDLISVGRSHISDADWVRKVREGRFGDIRAFNKADLMGEA